MFSGVTVLNCVFTIATPAGSRPVNCDALSAAPTRNAPLKASLSDVVDEGAVRPHAAPSARTPMMATGGARMSASAHRMPGLLHHGFGSHGDVQPPPLGQLVGDLDLELLVYPIEEEADHAHREGDRREDAHRQSNALKRVR